MKDNRRKLLKALTLGGSAFSAWKLPTDWSKPIVESVSLPAHAQTTDVPNIVTTGTIDTTEPIGAFHTPDILDTLAKPAYAVESFNFSACITVNRSAGTYDAFVIVAYDGFPAFRGTNLPVDGGDQSLDPDGICVTEANPLDLFVTSAYAPPSVGVDIRVYDITTSGAWVEVEVESTRWSGFLEWSDLNCGLSCGELDYPELVVSDRNIKEQFASVNEEEILERVSQMPIEYWNYTDRERGVRHIGPMAQDFHTAFNVGDSDRHIHMVDANGVNLASIKALYKRLQEKDEKIAALESDLNAIKEKLGMLS